MGELMVRRQPVGPLGRMYRNISADCPGIDSTESEELFRLLDGLLLAIAQASAYLRQSVISVAKYIQLYNQQRKSLMESQDRTGTPLRDYPNRSVWTTWTISYDAIRAKNTAAANVLLLWACLDNKDL
jgi:hypothetical protein